ncbi:MAG: hypothetical protein OEY11_12105 [Gammaproteobacteria bacterium]|nr:hypothetical protein [Gammaproteobacteria bacterium]
MYKITSLLFLSVLLTGCQLPESDDDIDYLTSLIIGRWKSSCLVSGSGAQPEYKINTLEFKDGGDYGSYYRSTEVYSDELCNDFVSSDEITGSYTYEVNRPVNVTSGLVIYSNVLEITIVDPITTLVTPSIHYITITTQEYADPGLYFWLTQIEPFDLILTETYQPVP